MNREVKIIQTEDGSHSLYVPDLNESYHSFHGAWNESMHVFIEKGLRYWRIKKGMPKQLNVFELGFGTGLNALQTALFASEYQFTVKYHTIEAFPLSHEVTTQLNHGIHARAEELFHALHEANWEEEVSVSDCFSMKKTAAKFESSVFDEDFYDLVYFDAFAPSKQSELWEPIVLEKVYRMMKPGGILTTYCAQGQFKRNLKAIGFAVETLPGPPGKKEMIRAEK